MRNEGGVVVAKRGPMGQVGRKGMQKGVGVKMWELQSEGRGRGRKEKNESKRKGTSKEGEVAKEGTG